MSHTPGPWRIDDGRIYAHEPSVAEEIMVCDLSPGNVALTEFDEHNALLIAAAPELLEALRNALDALKFYDKGPLADGTIKFGQAAIAKATLK